MPGSNDKATPQTHAVYAFDFEATRTAAFIVAPYNHDVQPGHTIRFLPFLDRTHRPYERTVERVEPTGDEMVKVWLAPGFADKPIEPRGPYAPAA